jgi:hypothetical protein
MYMKGDINDKLGKFALSHYGLLLVSRKGAKAQSCYDSGISLQCVVSEKQALLVRASPINLSPMIRQTATRSPHSKADL